MLKLETQGSCYHVSQAEPDTCFYAGGWKEQYLIPSQKSQHLTFKANVGSLIRNYYQISNKI